MGARLAKIGLAAARFSRAASTAALAACEGRYHLIARLRAVNSLLRQSHGAAGVGLLMRVLRLGLRQRGLRRLHLRLRAHHCA